MGDTYTLEKNSICAMSAAELVEAIRTREIGVEEATQAYLTRIEALDSELNTVAELNTQALAQARLMDIKPRYDLPLFGLPVLVKDNIDVAGLHTTAGSMALADNLVMADAPVIANLRAAGALILGKANLTEFANFMCDGSPMPNGFSSHGGRVHSKYGKDKDPGGSSTGSAVAVSAALCAAAVGTDTSFSIVGCATNNGVVGIKPAHGMLPSPGIVPISHSFDSAGPLARDMRDALLLYSGLRGEPLCPRPIPVGDLRFAVNTFGRKEVSKAQQGKYSQVLDAIRADGAQVGEVSHGDENKTMWAVTRNEFRADLEQYLAGTGAQRRTLMEIIAYYETNPQHMPYGMDILQMAQNSERGEDYRAARERMTLMRAQMIESLRNYDACLMTGSTNVMHFAGLPSVALPIGLGTDGAPRGMILYGADETRLLAAALTLEQYCQAVK